MKLLYIEDEEEKAKEISNFLDGLHTLDLAKSYTSGVIAICKKEYDLILLDMSLPLYDYESEDNENNEFDTFAGIDIIKELIRLNRKEKVVIITAFDILGEGDNKVDILQLDHRMIEDYSDIYLGIIHYNASSLEWQRELQEIIKRYENTCC